MKRLLLSDDEWRKLRMSGSSDELVAKLVQRGLVSEAAGLDAVERELRGECVAAASSLIRFLSGAGYDTLRFFIYYYDLLNIETVIAHLHFGSEAGVAEMLYDTGRLGLIKHDTLAAVSSFPALGSCLKGSVLYDAYKQGLESYERDGDISVFTAELELAFLKGWSLAERRCRRMGGQGKSIFSVYLKTRAADAMLRLRFRRESAEHAVERWNGLVPGGLLGKDLRDWNALDSEKDAFKYLASRVFGRHHDVGAGADSSADETLLQRGMLNETRRALRRGDFSIDYLLGFLFRLMLQAEDLVRLLECCDFGLDSDTASEYLIGEI
jgi:hypothetical protein